MIKKHKNSKLVKVVRLRGAMEKSQKEVQEHFANSSKGVGSYWERGTLRPGTGLTFREQSLIMPLILDLTPEDKDFRKVVTQYFHDLYTKVPSMGGVELEIGLEEDNDAEVSATNLPIKPEDYVRWRQITGGGLHGGHPEVALTEEDAKNTRAFQYYAYDPATLADKKFSKTEDEDEAITEFLKIKKSAKKVRMYAVLMGINPAVHSTSSSLVGALRDQVVSKPKVFLAYVNDPHQHLKYEISLLVSSNVLRKVGTRYLVTESGDELGKDLEETVLNLNDAVNSQMLNWLRAKLNNVLETAE